MKRKEITVGLVVGGASSEREVSKLSGKSVLDAVKQLGYNYKIIDPAYGILQPSNEEDFFNAKDLNEPLKSNYIAAINSKLFNKIDTVFNALHGTYGEDGIIQSLFELRGLRYTGSGVLPSSISMNKTFTKVMFKHYGVNTPEWLLVNSEIDFDESIIDEISALIKIPCVVKPNNQGSAIGLTICRSEEEIMPALQYAGEYSDQILIEKYIDGFELTVGILEQNVFPPLEIKPKHEFYDYECKYTKGMSEYEVPANFPYDVLEELKVQALYAYNSIGCKCYGRVDFRLSKNYQPYCLEVNTLPGLTSTSLLPKTAQAGGISFEDLIDRIILHSLNQK
jgi:D-alanine-D-alanine ligase